MVASPDQNRSEMPPPLFAGLQFPYLLPFVFLFAFIDGLPLHVIGPIRAAAFECLDVVNDVARAWAARVAVGRTGMAAHEFRALVRVAVCRGAA